MLNAQDIESSFNYPSSKGKVLIAQNDYSTSNYPPDDDSTSSGGSGSPEDAWSTPAQRGRHFPSHLSSTKQIYAPSPYTNTAFNNSTSSFYSRSSTPVVFAAEPTKAKPVVAGSGADSWESRREAMEMLTNRYRDSIKGNQD